MRKSIVATALVSLTSAFAFQAYAVNCSELGEPVCRSSEGRHLNCFWNTRVGACQVSRLFPSLSGASPSVAQEALSGASGAERVSCDEVGALLASAALNPRTSRCTAGIPAYCEFRAEVEGTLYRYSYTSAPAGLKDCARIAQSKE